MEDRGDQFQPIETIFDLDYFFHKCSWCIKNNLINCIRLCKYIKQIVKLSVNCFSFDHLSYANDIIEFLAENFSSEPRYVCHLKRMLVLCLMPPTVKSIMQCSENLSTLIKFYNVMAKCIWLVHSHIELNVLLFSVLQSSIFRRHPVPENSVSLKYCYEAIEMSNLNKTLMELIQKAPSQTFLDDLLKLTFNIATVSDQSAIQMMQFNGIEILVNVLNPNFIPISTNSYGRLTICEFTILLLNLMFSIKRQTKGISEPLQITHNTLEILLYNIKTETERNVRDSMKTRNDFCYILSEIVHNCSIDEGEFSNEIVTEIVMLCVWPEIMKISHWLDNVRFDFVNENFIFKNILLDIMNKVFVNLPRKVEFQKLNTFLIKEFMMLLDYECTKKTYGDHVYSILNRLLLSLPYLLLNSVDNLLTNKCCSELLGLIKSLKSQESFSRTMVNAIICIGITANDSYDMLEKFKVLKTDVLINSVLLDTLKTKEYEFQDIILYGLNVLNIFFREKRYNPEVRAMVFDTIIMTIKYYFNDDNDKKIDQNLLLDLLHFIKNSIIHHKDQVERFVEAGGIERLLDALTFKKYPIQLVILSILVDLAVYQSVKKRIKNWKCGRTNKSYLELMCDIWRREKVKYNFLEDEFVFQEQRERTTAVNLTDGRSPAVETMFLYAQPKIYLLVCLLEFSDDQRELTGRQNSSYENDIKENTVKACGLVSGFEDKATVAHIYNYYSLKLCEIWNENRIALSVDNDEPLSAVQSQSIDIMTARYDYLSALIKMIRRQVVNLDVTDSEIELENKLYEEIRRYNN